MEKSSDSDFTSSEGAILIEFHSKCAPITPEVLEQFRERLRRKREREGTQFPDPNDNTLRNNPE
jgi:hypothetical protein